TTARTRPTWGPPLGGSEVRLKPGSTAFETAPRLRTADREVLEPRELPDEGELDDARWAVALLADDQFGDALRIGRRLALVLVLILAVDEDHDVGVLFERARLAQVGQLRPVIRPRFRRAAQLRQDDDGDIQLLRQPFHRSRDR